MKKLKIFSSFILLLLCVSINAQNKITLRFLSLGGDGFAIMPGCELLYSRKISHGLDVRGGYTQASKNIKLNNSFVARESDLIKDEFLIETNSSENPTVEFIQYSSFNLGLAKVLNSSVRSDLTLYLGLRYETLNKLDFVSLGSSAQSIRSRSKKKRGISPELDISYNYRVSQNIGIGGSFYYSRLSSVFAGTLGASFYF